MSISITRRIQFSAGHRIHRHESVCRNIHGHCYVVYFTATAPELDDLGRVIDFSVLKEKLGGWVDANWDHGFLWHERDQDMKKVFEMLPENKNFPMPYNPTAENMARYLIEVVGPTVLADTGVSLIEVRVHETENCFAEAML